MKLNFLIILIATGMFFVACKTETAKTTAETVVTKTVETASTATKTTETGNYTVDVAASTLNWMGDKKLGEKHVGSIKLKDGSFSITDGQVTSGKATIDMGSITNSDVTDPKKNAKLVRHLGGEDFFDVAKFPTASIAITGANESGFEGNLTMKGIEKAIKIPGTVTKEGNNYVVTITPFTFNRTDWNIKYRSGNFFKLAKDKIINDAIELSGKIVLTPKS